MMPECKCRSFARASCCQAAPQRGSSNTTRTTAASIIHSLPLTSLLALSWIYWETKDTQLIASHTHGTFWFVLPTLPMFLVLPALLKTGWGYWPALALCLTGTFGLYLLTLWVTRTLDIKF
jgi:hypothetical protein